jgi:tetratricopeptide (TPR) repeat protein
MTVTALSASADDLMLINLDIKDGASDEEGPAFLARIRTAAARHPGDAFALEVLARAELAWGDDAAGETALQQLLAAQPDNVEALLMLADLRLEAGDQAPDHQGLLTLYREAQGLLARAYQADPTDYRVLVELARMRQGVADDYPTENDLATWRLAVQHAPQVPSVRAGAADAMLAAELYDEAEALLAPLANDPHGGGGARTARERLERIRVRREAAGQEPAADEPST